MAGGTHSTRRSRRLAALGVALAYLAAAASASLHLALQHHALCPVHGHLVHAHGPGAAPGHDEPSREAGRALQAGGEPDHESCDLARHRAGDGVQAPAAERAPVPAPRPAPDARPARPDLPAGPGVLARAPKQSPPAS